jgi:hypothetical protein
VLDLPRQPEWCSRGSILVPTLDVAPCKEATTRHLPIPPGCLLPFVSGLWSEISGSAYIGRTPCDEVLTWKCPCLGLSVHRESVGAWRIRRLQIENRGAHEFTQVWPPGG